jgi:hypothetical protein
MNQKTSWLVHSWGTFGAWTNHEHTLTHKIHHGLNLGEVTTFPLVIFSMIIHGGCIQMSFCPKTLKLGVPKFPNLQFLALWRAMTSCANCQLRWSLKKIYNPHQAISNDMWHATYTNVFHGNSWLLMGRSWIGPLTPNFSFGHNLCFKYSNGSCKPILNI